MNDRYDYYFPRKRNRELYELPAIRNAHLTFNRGYTQARCLGCGRYRTTDFNCRHCNVAQLLRGLEQRLERIAA